MKIITTRRHFGITFLAGGALLTLGVPGAAAFRGRDPFTLGVASGDPSPDGMVLWTRLAPDPLAPDGGMPPERMAVIWEIAEDEQFANPIRGTAIADPAWGHSVHVEIAGLKPGRRYFYRFISGGIASPVGRTLTAPPADGASNRLRLAFASCQHYEAGHYAAYRHIVADDPDLVLFLGDYIYEGNPGANGVRRHLNPEPTDLAGYRTRYATYKLDPLLQEAHRAAPWVTTWDDHEVQDNYAGTRDKRFGNPAVFARRRAAAYQAYYEHLPLRASARPRDGSMRLYRALSWGNLARLQVLDDRQYRDTAACQPADLPGSGREAMVLRPDCPERHDARRALLGTQQMTWLDRELSKTRAQWNLLVQQTLMMPFRRIPDNDPALPPSVYNTDAWDGFTPARTHIQRRWRNAQVRNPIVLSGDIHSFVAGDHFDPDNPKQIIASEFVGGSISSGARDLTLKVGAAQSPGFHFAENQVRGYGQLELTPTTCEVVLRGLTDVRDPNSSVIDLARFAVEAGKPGIQAG